MIRISKLGIFSFLLLILNFILDFSLEHIEDAKKNIKKRSANAYSYVIFFSPHRLHTCIAVL